MTKAKPFGPRAKLVCATLAAIAIFAVVALALAIALGTASAPQPMTPRQLDRVDLPPLGRYAARDGSMLAYRAYPGGEDQVVILMHGTGPAGIVMNAVAKSLRASGASVYTPDLRGHGASGRRGDIDYVGQLDDDLADLVSAIRPRHPHARYTLIGFSGSAAFAMRVAGGRYGDLFDRYIVIAPALHYPADVARPNADGWAVPYYPRIVGLMILDRLEIHWFDGLETIAFAVAPSNAEATGHYTFRLMSNMAVSDIEGTVGRIKKPMTLLVGADDEQFYASRYERLLRPAKPDINVEIIPGLGHVDMITKATGITAITHAFEHVAK